MLGIYCKNKIKRIGPFLINGIIVVCLLSGCKSVTIVDPLVLSEIAPLPRTVVVKPVIEYEPVYSVMRIIEVSEENGLQKYFLVRLGADKTGVARGVSGDIAEDADFQKIIGTYKIIEIYGDFFRGQIDSLSYKIGPTAYIRVKTGEKVKEEK